MNIPDDPYLKDAEGASKSCRDLMSFRGWRARGDYMAAIYWSARCAAHWAFKSEAWKRLNAGNEAK